MRGHPVRVAECYVYTSRNNRMRKNKTYLLPYRWCAASTYGLWSLQIFVVSDVFSRKRHSARTSCCPSIVRKLLGLVRTSGNVSGSGVPSRRGPFLPGPTRLGSAPPSSPASSFRRLGDPSAGCWVPSALARQAGNRRSYRLIWGVSSVVQFWFGRSGAAMLLLRSIPPPRAL